MPDDLASTAHHVAGRIVAAIVLGGPFTVAAIGDDGSGEVEPAFQLPQQRGDELSPEERTLIEDAVVQLFAGAYAEERFSGRTLTEHDKHGLMTMPTSDWFDVAVSGRTLDSGDDMDALSEEARVLVEHHWDAIASVAGVLLRRTRITRAEAARLLDEHPARAEMAAGTESGDSERP